MSDAVVMLRPQPAMVVSRLRKINKGALVGFFDLEITGWRLGLHDCTWFCKDDREWIGLPSVKVTTKEGNAIWKKIVEFTDRQADARFQAAALEAVRLFDRQGA